MIDASRTPVVPAARTGSARLDLPRLGGSSLRDQVASVLEARILDGSVAAGSRLPTAHELGASFGVSRTVIRDALRVLEGRGLVDIRRGTGTVVKPTSAETYASAAATMLLRSRLTLGDVFAARAALEGPLTVVAAREHTPAQRARIETALVRFEAAVREGEDADAIVSGHVDFHTELLRATNLPALELLLGPIQEMMLATSVVARGADPRDSGQWRAPVHRALFDAVARRDVEAVARASEKHWAVPLRGRSYAEIRRVRLDAMVVSPRELLAVQGGPGGRDA